MRKTIENFYYGNLVPFETSPPKSREYQTALSKASAVREKLESTLNDEEKALLNQYCDLHGTLSALMEFEHFLNGFRTSCRLLLDANSGSSDEKE